MMKNWNIDLECSYSDITFLGMFEPVVRLRKCGIYPMFIYNEKTQEMLYVANPYREDIIHPL